jgi:gluconate 2-dehydrogenase gamma chain
MSDLQNRRAFLRAAAAAGVVWAADFALVEGALAWTAQQTAGQKGAPFAVLSPEEADAIVAMTERILPSVDGRAGAREAGVVYFIDRALATFNSAQRTLYSEGVKDLNAQAARKPGGASSFAALNAQQQDDVLREIEKTPFFEAVRFGTIVGMFALPAWGGNRDFAGWHMLGLNHAGRYDSPFGYYDAEAAGRG